MRGDFERVLLVVARLEQRDRPYHTRASYLKEDMTVVSREQHACLVCAAQSTIRSIGRERDSIDKVIRMVLPLQFELSLRVVKLVERDALISAADRKS